VVSDLERNVRTIMISTSGIKEKERLSQPLYPLVFHQQPSIRRGRSNAHYGRESIEGDRSYTLGRKHPPERRPITTVAKYLPEKGDDSIVKSCRTGHCEKNTGTDMHSKELHQKPMETTGGQAGSIGRGWPTGASDKL
jgi:hypothetical protein